MERDTPGREHAPPRSRGAEHPPRRASLAARRSCDSTTQTGVIGLTDPCHYQFCPQPVPSDRHPGDGAELTGEQFLDARPARRIGHRKFSTSIKSSIAESTRVYITNRPSFDAVSP